MKRFTYALLFTLGISLTSQATSSLLSSALELTKETRFQDGANCFNTSLYALGYTPLKSYTHQAEFEYFLKFHCRETPINLQKLTPNSMLTFTDSNQQLLHSAVALDFKNVLEKNSLYGSKHQEVFGDPNPGQYLVHPVSESVFFKKLIAPTTGDQGHAYLCQSKEVVQAALKEFSKDEGINNIHKFLGYLADLTEIKDRKALEKKLNKDLIKKYRSLKIKDHLAYISGNRQLDNYKLGIAESAAYQWTLLNCTDAYEKYEECYAPEVQTSIAAVEDLYSSIYIYRDYVKSQFQYK